MTAFQAKQLSLLQPHSKSYEVTLNKAIKAYSIKKQNTKTIGQNSSQYVTGLDGKSVGATTINEQSAIMSKSSNYNISLNSKSFQSRKNINVQTFNNLQVDRQVLNKRKLNSAKQYSSNVAKRNISAGVFRNNLSMQQTETDVTRTTQNDFKKMRHDTNEHRQDSVEEAEEGNNIDSEEEQVDDQEQTQEAQEPKQHQEQLQDQN